LLLLTLIKSRNWNQNFSKVGSGQQQIITGTVPQHWVEDPDPRIAKLNLF
jgi:hypothetical protein